MEFLPEGVLKVNDDDEVWSAKERTILAMGREFDVSFDRVQCCHPKRLVETDASHGSNREPVIGKLIRDRNEPRRRNHCPRENAIRMDFLIDASASMRPLLGGVAMGLNGFLESVRSRVSEKTATMTRVRLRVFGTSIDSKWWCTPLDSAPRVDVATLEIQDDKTALVDSVGQALSDLDVMNPRIMILLTDGRDTASKKISRDRVSKLVQARRRMGWTFIVLAAYNPHDRHPGPLLGVSTATCATFRFSPAGVRAALLLAAVSAARAAEGNHADFTDVERLSAVTGTGCLFDYATTKAASRGGEATFGGGCSSSQMSSSPMSLRSNLTRSTPRFSPDHEPSSTPLKNVVVSLIVDGSGSMRGLGPATVNGLNNFVETLRWKFDKIQNVKVQFHAFGDIVRSKWGNGKLLGDVPRVSAFDLAASRRTALVDALGITLSTQPVDVAQIVAIITDGRDNASHQFTGDDVVRIVDARRRNGWTFLFLAAATPFSKHPGPNLGFPPETTTSFSPTADGVRSAFRLCSAAVTRIADGLLPNFTLAERSDACASCPAAPGTSSDRRHSLDYSPR